jgi:ABC-type lipoprotein release transport system permease subunit
MKKLFTIAWRNLWRNKRRTMITVASVLFALFIALVMRSMQIGTYEVMLNDAIKNSSGFIQIQHKKYWDEKTIDNTFVLHESFTDSVSALPNITGVIPRLESFSLISSGNITKGVGLMGVEPETEHSFIKLAERVTQGSYFGSDNDDGILLGDDLARYLEVAVGDTLVLLSQGFRGATAAGVFPVRGIFHFPAPEMNKNVIFMTLRSAQYFFAADSRITSLAIMLEKPEKLDKTLGLLNKNFGNTYGILKWDEMMVELKQQIQSDSIGGIFMLAILYLIVTFGIFGTILMMTHERRREFAVMIAMGMQRFKLSMIIFTETIYMGLLGIAAGTVAAMPVLWYLALNPIPLEGEMAAAMEEFNVQPVIPFSVEPALFINQTIVVLIITACIALYPVINIRRFDLTKGLRS